MMSLWFKWLPREVTEKVHIYSLLHYVHMCMCINFKSTKDEVYDTEVAMFL